MNFKNPAHRIILDLVPEGASVLDLGCGDGELLQALLSLKKTRGQGVEIDAALVTQCVGRGIPVFHGNIDEGLKEYPDHAYDIVILNQTLQAVHRTEFVLMEMLRVGKRAIVGIPNFAHWRIRLQLLLLGRLPMTPVYNFEWYNTPNIRLTTIRDFKKLCERLELRIVCSACLQCEPGQSFLGCRFPNLFSENAVFVLEKNS